VGTGGLVSRPEEDVGGSDEGTVMGKPEAEVQTGLKALWWEASMDLSWATRTGT